MTPDELGQLIDFDVSRETLGRLEAYASLLETWNTRVNLIARGDVPQIWERHIADSLQLLPYITGNPEGAIDVGSGAGLPAIPLAIASGVPFSLIESDRRKAAFLREAARATAAPIHVFATRAESARLPPKPLVTARALAPLTTLLALAEPFLAPAGVCLFPKGARVDDELTAAAQQWHMRVERFPSRTDSSGTILRISEIHRVTAPNSYHRDRQSKGRGRQDHDRDQSGNSSRR